MADHSKATGKRGRPKISDSERKRRKLERKKTQDRTRIYLGTELTRWENVKLNHNLQSDREVATLLLDRYQQSAAGSKESDRPRSSTEERPGTSGTGYTAHVHLTSTPGVGHVHVVSTPSVSSVSAPDANESEIDVLSGLENIASSGESKTESQMTSRGKSLVFKGKLVASKGKKSKVAAKGKGSSTRPTIPKTLSSSFMDPSEMSIDITHIDIEKDSDEDDEDDPDYEPSVLISSILPKDLEDQAEDVAFEEAEFGLERVEGDQMAEDDFPGEEIVLDGMSHVKSDEDVDFSAKEFKCICFLSQLMKLAKLKFDKCSTCGSYQVEIVDNYIGSAVYLKWICKEGHVSMRWCSQPILNRRMNCGDFMICSTILTSGNNFSKMRMWADMLHMKFPSANQFHGVQGKYLVPTIDAFWEEHQRETLDSFQNQDLVVLGDGRNDSPGHCAQYCSYTIMEQVSKKILTLKTLDKRITGRKSVTMEKVAFETALTELKDKGLSVKEVVTDAHMGIGALMKSNYRDIKHSHDIWHVAKNLGKKLSKIAQRKGNGILTQWNRDIVNHFWFTCKTAENYGQFVGIWSSVLHHVVDEHEWILSHGGDGINQCLHEPLRNEDRDKPWLHRSKDKQTLKDLASEVLDKRLLKNVPYYLNFRSTAELEGFHQHILMYCAKRFSYTPPIYRIRNLLTALDHNMHVDRPNTLNKDGTMRLQRVWNKKSGRWSVYPQKEKKEYGYIDNLLINALKMRLQDRVGMYKPRQLEPDDPRRLSKHLAPVSPKPTADIYEEQKSRFK